MKVGSVSADKIGSTHGLRLDPAHYLCPTDRIDQEIARAKASIQRWEKRLDRLEEERQRILGEV